MSRVVTNTIELAADADAVFDYMTDLRNEPRWNPHMRDVEKTTDGVVGHGTRFRVTFGRGVGEALVEHTAFDRPRSWSSLSRSRLLDVESANHVEPIPGGCRLVIGTQLSPRGALRLSTPLLRHWMHATWARDLRTVKAQVERVSQETS
jgi:Polyketide cyclase / dehydrase and lipid transport